MAKVQARQTIKPRERLLDAAYDLFASNGISQVGIDTILAKSGCAKASLYSNFQSKVDLAVAFLDQREAVWTRGWLEAEITRRASDPEQRLLAIFDVFDGWFRKRNFEGCSFINGVARIESRQSYSLCGRSPLVQDSGDCPGVGQRCESARARKICTGLAYADEGLDRFGLRRQPECCA